MKNILLIRSSIILLVIILLICMYKQNNTVVSNVLHKDGSISRDEKNKRELSIDNFIRDRLRERVKLLDTTDINTFINYIHNNMIVKYNDLILHYAMIEIVTFSDGSIHFPRKVFPNKEALNLSNNETEYVISNEHHFKFNRDKLIKRIINNQLNGTISQYYDPFTHRLVNKKFFAILLKKENFYGYIELSYNLSYINNNVLHKNITISLDKKNNQEQNIETYIKSKLQERYKLLETMDIQHFIHYNLNNISIKNNDLILYFYIWELVQSKHDDIPQFILRACPDKNVIGYNYIEYENIHSNWANVNLSEQQICDMLYLHQLNGYKYKWYDPITQQLVNKRGFAIDIIKENFNGFIGIDYNLSNIV
uniref:Uncharacterized protein n=1 Tax=viral metagenome TaxID=1070528 RepID=A0A6C0HH12_9ZZZZ